LCHRSTILIFLFVLILILTEDNRVTFWKMGKEIVKDTVHFLIQILVINMVIVIRVLDVVFGKTIISFFTNLNFFESFS
jgi:hypothetical protein